MWRLIFVVVAAWAVGLLWGMSCPLRLPVWTVLLGLVPGIPASWVLADIVADMAYRRFGDE